MKKNTESFKDIDETKNPKYKSTLCKNFQNDQKCKFGDKCNFAHGTSELKLLFKENNQNSSQSSILYIRHGETMFNKKIHELKTMHFVNEEKYIDCSIIEDHENIKSLAEKLSQLDFKYVFTSPMNRCLETINLALKSHPKRQNISIFIHPLISEHISGSQHNICLNIEGKKKIYNKELKFDWKYFDLYNKENPKYKNENMFYFNFIDSKNIIENFDSLGEKLEKGYNFENINEFLLAATAHNKKGFHPESFNALNTRCKKFKDFLRGFVKENKIDLSKEKILIFTHSGVIKLSSSKIAEKSNDISFYPNDSIYPKVFAIINIDI